MLMWITFWQVFAAKNILLAHLCEKWQLVLRVVGEYFVMSTTPKQQQQYMKTSKSVAPKYVTYIHVTP